MKVKPRETVVFNGRTYRAGDELPSKYVELQKKKSEKKSQNQIQKGGK